MRILFGVLALSCLASPTMAQQAIVLERLQALNAAAPTPSVADLRAAAMADAQDRAASKGTCVPASMPISDVVPITGANGIFAAVLSGKFRNAWTFYAQHVGCSGKTPTRYIAIQLPDGRLQVAKVSTGETLANPSIMRDTSYSAALAALMQAKKLDGNCSGADIAMGPTRVTARSKDLDAETYGVHYVGSWTEIWQFKTCGKTYDVPIDFKADGDGGAYTHIRGSSVILEQGN